MRKRKVTLISCLNKREMGKCVYVGFAMDLAGWLDGEGSNAEPVMCETYKGSGEVKRTIADIEKDLAEVTKRRYGCSRQSEYRPLVARTLELEQELEREKKA